MSSLQFSQERYSASASGNAQSENTNAEHPRTDNIYFGTHGGNSLVLSDYSSNNASFTAFSPDSRGPMQSADVETKLPKSNKPTFSAQTIIQEVPISELMHRLGAKRGWSELEIASDVNVLVASRILTLNDLKRLKNNQMYSLDLLPIVKQMLTDAV